MIVTVGNYDKDQRDEWHVVEGVAREGIGVISHYRAQIDKRKK